MEQLNLTPFVVVITTARASVSVIVLAQNWRAAKAAALSLRIKGLPVDAVVASGLNNSLENS